MTYFESTWIIGNFRFSIWNIFQCYRSTSNNFRKFFNRKLSRDTIVTYFNPYKAVTIMILPICLHGSNQNQYPSILIPLLFIKTISIMAKLALTSAIQNAFPNIEMKGCHFHYSQCLWTSFT